MDPVTWTMPVSVTHAAYERADGFVITNTATVTGIGFERDLSDNTTEVTTTAGGPAFTLTVTGTGFVAGSVVQWDGADRATSFVSTTQLTTTIPAGDIASAGTVSITVFSPTPGGGVSSPETFTIYTATRASYSPHGVATSVPARSAEIAGLTILSKKCLAPEPAPTLTDGRASW
jgi:hypothetical protein